MNTKHLLQLAYCSHQLGSDAGHFDDLFFDGGLFAVGAALQVAPSLIEVRHGR